METLRLLKNKLQVASYFRTDYERDFKKEYAVGDTIRVKFPQMFLIRDGLTYSAQNIDRIETTVTVDQPFGIDFEWDSLDEALFMERGQDRIREEYLVPAATQLAQEIDSRAALFGYQNSNNIVGVLGTDPSAFSTFGQARQRMVELACPPEGKKAIVIPPSVNTSMVSQALGYFQPADAIARQYKEGVIGRAQGYDWYESMSLYSHTAGTWASAVTVNGAVSNGATSISVNCTNGDTFKKGDVFGIASVYPVNPRTRRRTQSATTMQFCVGEDVTAAGTTATIPLASPQTIYGPGSQYQNVDALPANGAALTLFPGTSSPNGKSGKQALLLHNQAFALVGVPLMLPKAVEIAKRTTDPETGISVAFIRAFDPLARKMINRFDVLIGFGKLYTHNCAVRIQCA